MTAGAAVDWHRPLNQVCLAHVEALVIMFTVITDLENVRFDYLLGHKSYDQDGNHFVSARVSFLIESSVYPALPLPCPFFRVRHELRLDLRLRRRRKSCTS